MDRFAPLLLAVWREACRHIEIETSVPTLAAILAHRLPLDRVIVRRLDAPQHALVTVGVGDARGASAHEPVRTELSRDALRRILAWARRDVVLRGTAGATPELVAVVPATETGSVLVVALRPDDHAPLGVLILVARPGETFRAEHEVVAAALREPFTVALDNDRRLHEMAALREAAEADRRSLLARLGRQDMVDEVVGADSGLRAVMERVALVSASSVPVLIFGDTGTGKELVARSIHARSARAAGPFLRVNCGAIPPELVDSELFGHEIGAFTGAVAQRRGWFERADGGTLFLDEVGELPPAAQVRLLTVVQDGWLERVGGHAAVKVDVRIVAATHRDLTAMVREGRFREDLWYRLAVFSILLPPLRERPEDIPALAVHFARRAATRFGLPLCLPSAADTALLASYAWPGNIRELGTVIDRAAILGEGHRLEVVAAMGLAGGSAVSVGPIGLAGVPAPAPPFGGALATLDEAMRTHIERALAVSAGRIEGPHGAAVTLGINPHTLRARMRKLGVDRGRFHRR